MIGTDYVQTMARYNQWQNKSIYHAADTLSDGERRATRGAFWGSIHGTLCHLVWGDQQWLSRFAGSPKPPVGLTDSSTMITDWTELKRQREAFDEAILDWTSKMRPDWLAGDFRWYSGIAKQERVLPAWLLVTHFFNHQTHHRGQAHAMLTTAGARPEDTDLMLMDAGHS